jgi:hypothetical protein
MAQHEGIAWAGMVIRGREPEGPGEVVGYAAVRRIGALYHRDGQGWWCAYIGMPSKYEASLRELDARGDIHGGITFTTLSGMVEAEQSLSLAWVPLELKGFCWIGWDYAHAGDFTGLAEEAGGKVWTLEEVVEQELMDAVGRLDLGEGYPARGIAGRVVSPEEWRHGC